MALTAFAIAAAGVALAGGGLLVGHPCGPYVYRPSYSPTFNPYYCEPYSYPMMCMGPGMGTSMAMGPSFYPWSPMPWYQPSTFQPSTFGYW